MFKLYRKLFYFALRGMVRHGSFKDVETLLRLNADVIYFRSDEFLSHLMDE